MMVTLSKQLPSASVELTSTDAMGVFKSNINESLPLLGYMNDEDKENIWRFWKTISSAVKIAVNGKGNAVDTPRKSSKHSRQDAGSSIFSSEHYDPNMITVCVPIQGRRFSERKCRLLKLENNEKIANYFESMAVARDDNDIGTCFLNATKDSDLNTHCGISESIEVWEAQQNYASCLKSRQSAPKTPPQSKQMVRIMGSKATKLIWPVSRPVTRSLQNINVTKSSDCLQSQKVDKDSESASVVTDVGVLHSHTDITVPSETNKNSAFENNFLDHLKDHTVPVSGTSDYKTIVVSTTEGAMEINSEQYQPQQSIVHVNMPGVTSEDTVAQMLSENEHILSEDGDGINAEVGIATMSFAHDPANTGHQSVSSTTIKNIGHHDENSKTFTHESDQPADQDIKRQGNLAQRNASDIETIISALEEELKKSGSGITAISVTSSGTPAQKTELSSSISSEPSPTIPAVETATVKYKEPSGRVSQLHIVDASQLESVWTTLGEVQIVGEVVEGSAAPIPAPAAATTTTLAPAPSETSPVDAGYDVVEYEVLSDKQLKRGCRKKVRGSAVKEENLDRTCPLCHRVLRYASSMAAHMRIHTGAKPYSCGQCDRKFTTKANRDRHEATHVGLKPFQCSTCSKRFTEKRSLNVHMRTHTGERPFVCQVCGQGFTQNCTLRVHMDRHSNKKGHLCDLCGKAFRQKCQLDIHVKRHNRQAAFPCKECSTKCYTRGDLMRHMIKHTGERPFQCSECQRAFTRKQYLIDHLNIHYGRKPYKCSECSAAFHDMGSCHRHLRKHKTEDSVEGKGKEKAAVLDSKEFHRILEGTHIGQILKLQDGTDAVVKAVVSEADGSTVYHITCLNNTGGASTAQDLETSPPT